MRSISFSRGRTAALHMPLRVFFIISSNCTFLIGLKVNMFVRCCRGRRRSILRASLPSSTLKFMQKALDSHHPFVVLSALLEGRQAPSACVFFMVRGLLRGGPC